MFLECTKFYAFLVGAIILFYTIGLLILKLFYSSSNRTQSSFYKLSVGLVFSVVTLSLVLTSLRSIYLVALIPIVSLIYIHRSSFNLANPLPHINVRAELFEILKLAVIAIPLFIFAAIPFFKMGEFMFEPQHFDFKVYSTISQSFWQAGNENYFGESNMFFPDKFQGLNPYHYFEIYVNTIVGTLFRTSYLNSLILIAFPLLQLVCIVGIIELLNTVLDKKRSIVWLAFMAFVLILVQPIFNDFYNKIELFNYSTGITNASIIGFGRKYSPVFMFSILFLLEYGRNNRKTAFIILSMLPLLSIGLLPGVTLGLIIFFGYKFLTTKDMQYAFGICYICGLSFLILFFYKINAIPFTESLVSEENFIQIILSEGVSITLLKQFFFKMAFPFIRVAAFTSPYLILIFALYKIYHLNVSKRDKDLVILTILILLSGALGAGIAYNLPDAGQLLINCLPLMNLILIYFLIKSGLKHSSLFLVAFLVLASAYNVKNNYDYILFKNMSNENRFHHNLSDAFMNECVNEIKNIPTPKIAYLYNDPNIQINPRIERFKNPGLFFSFSNSNPLVTCINDPASIDTRRLGGYFKYMWPLYIYGEDHDMPHDDLMLDFVRNFDIRYLLMEGPNVPAPLSLYTKSLYSDSISSYSFHQIELSE